MFDNMLAKFVSYPRQRYQHDGWNLDLAIITDNIVVMSLPSSSWPENMYRNDLHQVKKFLDSTRADKYKIFDLRAEGAGYLDADWDNRVEHFPFVDHHPPAFKLLPQIVDAMHAHLSSSTDATAVIHCKAGKGRSGLSLCSYLVTHRQWKEADARALFTAKRMREGFGEGVSIPSQLRYLRYVESWARRGRLYNDLQVTIEKVEVVNLRPGSRLAIRGFEDNGAVIKTLHEFDDHAEISSGKVPVSGDVITTMRPSQALVVGGDVGINLTKGNAFAHFWINLYFESLHGATIFKIPWEEVDGWKGTKWRGTRAYDSIAIHWRNV